MFKKKASVCLLFYFVIMVHGREITDTNDDENNLNGRLKARASEKYVSTNDYNNVSPVKVVKRSPGTQLTYIAMFTEHSAPGAVISAFADSTMTKLIVKVEVMRSTPVMLATEPSGIPYRGHPYLNDSASSGTVVAILEINITEKDYGIWKITKLDGHIWDVEIMAESPVGIMYEMLDVATGHVISEDPLQGRNYTIIIDVPNYTLVKSVNLAMLFLKELSRPIDMRPLVDLGGGRYEFNYTMLKQSFILGIQGSDNSRHMVRRVSHKPVYPVGLKLIVPTFNDKHLYENETLDLDFVVLNVETQEQDVDVRLDDYKSFALPPLILSATIKPGENFTGHFTLRGGFVGESTTVNITARPYLGHGHFGNGPSVVRMFTVERNISTITSSSTTTTTSTSSRSTPTTSTTTFSPTPETSSTFMTSMPVPALTSRAVTSLQNITSTSLQNITPTSLQNITPTSLQNITPTNLQNITQTSLQNMTSISLQNITLTSFQNITPTSLQNMISTNLQNITPTSLQNITPTSLQNITPTSLQNIRSTAVSGLLNASALLPGKQLPLSTSNTVISSVQTASTSVSPDRIQTNQMTATESTSASSFQRPSETTTGLNPSMAIATASTIKGNQTVTVGKLHASGKQPQRHASQTMILIKILQGNCENISIEESDEN